SPRIASLDGRWSAGEGPTAPTVHARAIRVRSNRTVCERPKLLAGWRRPVRGITTPSMHEELPPIAFLRAFSRAAETLSLKEAAADLNLSPSAVSRQIQSLEAHLGIMLFRRLNPGLEITE